MVITIIVLSNKLNIGAININECELYVKTFKRLT